ncbi:hypothetical protein QP028_15365 [Corynebacterium suedekumii]|nr:hypothetical protein QP028_15365 [Corynebacterium suedekumii]
MRTVPADHPRDTPATTRLERARKASLRVRRGLVLGGVVIWVALGAGPLIGVDGLTGVWWWALFASYGGIWSVLRVLIRDIAERSPGEIDEYEKARRARARDVGYVAALAVALVLFVVFSVATSRAQAGAPGLLLRADTLLFAAFLLLAALPTFLLAWTTPNDEDE